MRSALSPNDPRLRDLVAALDRDDVAVAETWRQVGEAAWRLGLRRPCYHVVRADRGRRAARGEVRRVAARVLFSVTSPYVVRIGEALDALEDAQARERLVLKQHKRSSAPP